MTKNLRKLDSQRQLTPETMQTYVNDGPGVDTAVKKNLTTADRPLPATSRLTIDLPRETHIRFKVACAQQGKKMNEELRELVQRRLRELAELPAS